MGKHYVPRAHLRRFQSDDRADFIWMFDKKSGHFSHASISKVAQEPDFYSQGIEDALAEVVEHPGNKCIDKLLGREKLDDRDRTQLSLYLMIMATRGPRQRRKSLEQVPTILEDIYREFRSEIEEWIQEDGDDLDFAKARLNELELVEQKFSKEIPREVFDQIRAPFWSETTVECILNMAWHIVPAPPGKYFVTCDTPAHLFEGLGLGQLDSEFTFPLSKSYALIGEQRRSWGTKYERPQAQLVKEVNRRILSHAERFVFSPRKEDWITTVAQKKDPYLSQIRWN